MKFVTIRTYNLPVEAMVHQSKLDAFGIRYHLQDELTIQNHNFFSNAIGGVKLQVLEQDAEYANEVLKIKPSLGDDELLEKSVTCPNCNSAEIVAARTQTPLGRMVLLLSGILFPARAHRYLCSQCNHKFKDPNIIPNQDT